MAKDSVEAAEPRTPVLLNLAVLSGIYFAVGVIATDGGGVLRLGVPIWGGTAVAYAIARARRGPLDKRDSDAVQGVLLLSVLLAPAFAFAWSLYAMSPGGGWLKELILRGPL